jgi:putative phage-type endonuclease
MSADVVERNREAWKRQRRQGITASEIASVLGIAPDEWQGPFALYHSKVTGQDYRDDSEAMMRGRILEPYVLERFAQARPDLSIRPGGLYCHGDRSWQMATFDALVEDEPDRLVWTRDKAGIFNTLKPAQAKTSGTVEGYGEDGTSVIPGYYRAQALWEMDTAQADTVYVPVLFMVPWRVRVFVLHRDTEAQRDIDFMLEQAQAFRSRVEHRNPPAVDWRPSTTATLRAIHPDLEDTSVKIPVALRLRYAAARRSKKIADRRVTQAANEIRARMGSAARAHYVDPATGLEVPVVSRSKYDVQPYQVNGFGVDKLNPLTGAK